MCWTKEQIISVNLVKIVELMHHLANGELAVSLDIVGYGKQHHRKHLTRRVKEKFLVGHFCITQRNELTEKECHVEMFSSEKSNKQDLAMDYIEEEPVMKRGG